jgi:glucose/arabinose dehydrogenase
MVFLVYFGQSDNLSYGESKVIFGCVPIPDSFHCDPVPNKFNALLVSGEARQIYSVSPSAVELVSGKFGNGLPLKGYIGQYLTIPNSPSITPTSFSISLWAKHDPTFALDGSIISHENREKTAGWTLGIKYGPQFRVQFTIANTQSKEFTITSPIETDKFEFIAVTFDGKAAKLYLNGILRNSTEFFGRYEPDPSVPMNVGIDSFDLTNAWKGTVDELRLFNRAISDNEVKAIFNNKINSNEGVIGYWPFDNDTKDVSGNKNNGMVSIQVVSMAFAPDGRLFFTEKNAGEVRIMKDDVVLPPPFVKIKDIIVAQHQGLLGITLDPKFATNHFVYLYYTALDNNTGDIFNRVVRFTESNGRGTAEKILLENIPASQEGEYAGGALAFGPDDKLYVSVGHANLINSVQNKSSLVGKILRIDRDGTVPADNPFPNSPIFTLGHRNIFGIAFDKKTGTGAVTENGDAHYDEVNILHKGANYGFPTTQPPALSPQLDNSSSIKPIRAYWETIAPTQAIFYDGNKFAQLKDNMVFGSYNKGFIYSLKLNKSNSVTDELGIDIQGIDDNVIALAQSPSGELYFGGYNIYKLTSINMAEPVQTMHFIEVSLESAIVRDPNFDANNGTFSFEVTTSNVDGTISSPFIELRIPKIMLNGISQVYSQATGSSNSETPIIDFNIKQQFRTSNIGDTIVQIKLKNGVKDTIFIKGLKSNPVPN